MTKPWSLLSLATALRDLSRDTEAAEVALSLPEDHTAGAHLAWLALDAARAGDVASANALLTDIGDSTLGTYYQAVVLLARSLLDNLELPHGKAFVQAYSKLARARHLVPGYRKQPALKRAVRLALWRAKRTRGDNAPLAFWACLRA